MDWLDRLIGRGGSSSLKQAGTSKSVLSAIVGHEFTIGQSSNTLRPFGNIEVTEIRGRLHLNVRTHGITDLQVLKGKKLVVVRRSDLVEVGTMVLGLQGSVIFSDMDIAPNTELKSGEGMRIQEPGF